MNANLHINASMALMVLDVWNATEADSEKNTLKSSRPLYTSSPPLHSSHLAFHPKLLSLALAAIV